MPKSSNRHSRSVQFFTKVLVLFFIVMPVLALTCEAASKVYICSQSHVQCNQTAVVQCHLGESVDQIEKNKLPTLSPKIFQHVLFFVITSPRVITLHHLPIVQHPILSPIEIPLVDQKVVLIV